MSKIAFIYPGQGTQYVGMGKELYETNEMAKKYFDEIFDSLDLDLKETMFNGPEEKLKQTKYTQPAIVTMSLVLTKLLKDSGIEADYAAGHSLGEYSALGTANVLSTCDTVRLTALRGEIMNVVSGEVDGTMAAIIGLESAKIEEICESIDGIVEAVNYNEPKQTVIAGSKDAIAAACEKLKEAGAKRAMVLAVSGPFHSSLMKPAGDRLKADFDKFNFMEGNIEILSNTGVEFLKDAAKIKEELYHQTFGPVRWVETIEKLRDNGVTKFYEIGPGKVLKGLVRKIDKTLEVVNVESI
ncbi:MULTISPECIES: ACP S-malonyltransferase [Psychrilyobacter]|uniref:Malonyl CoA-acyl carrier protein transacylase n=1 Tax=Psychrilyobacter piezotolerans TaxID=2293438 RepID=A0ABX9KL02_9FUSO|nr:MULTISPECIES: ACP S-malonyltransferase [Psychrilyobacter]MCS5421783.1 ACP S-malonyltransferase [Psychrilyobacter sp. S5]NDI76464.1 ACP S-malonyltransferase [Psychrilyobacter piezotolerans]RDE66058.1 [acyl-carrier-protein] S-malonyltransferase [Psychrilyobacter sp. S5]REI43236.1 [acyl-carrier-protein] S-malonyltransferase [Psychrilyobacter piezotolerans]